MAAFGEPRGPLPGAAGPSRSPALRADNGTGINDLQSIVEEAVEMNGSVLVAFSHKDVFEPLPPHGVVKPSVELARDLSLIIAVNFSGVKGEGNEVTEIVGKSEITNGSLRPALRAGEAGRCAAILARLPAPKSAVVELSNIKVKIGQSLPSFALLLALSRSRRGPVVAFAPPGLPEDCPVRDHDLRASIREGLDPAIMQQLGQAPDINKRCVTHAGDGITSLYQVGG